MGFLFSCSTSFKFSDSDSISEADESDEDELVVKFGSLTESSSSMDIELDGDSGRVMKLEYLQLAQEKTHLVPDLG